METEPAVHDPSQATKRKYVTRACDLCKKKKIRCNGEECVAAKISCTYESAYLRGPKARRIGTGSETRHTSELADRRSSLLVDSPPRQQVSDNSISTPLHQNNPSPLESLSGDTSARAFLARVCGHLSAAGHAMPRYLSRPPDRVLPDEIVDSTIVLPDKSTTLSYLECFTEHAQVTYRYVPRRQWFSLVTRLYDDDETLLTDDAAMALLLLVIGLGTRLYKAAKSRLNKVATVFPPTVLALQAYTLECQLLLTMNHFNTAWIALGSAVRTGQIIGFQRGCYDQRSTDKFEETKRRSCFWALFMLDRYLSTVLGRPMMLNENDITIPLPGVSPTELEELEPQEVKLMAGMVAHIKLIKIIGRIMTKIYPATSPDTSWNEKAVREFEISLREWQDQTPSFFHPDKKTGGISAVDEPALFEVPWSFKRQQRTVRMTYHFVNMLMYRGCLLDEFLRTTANTPRESPPTLPVQKCVQAAIHMASFAAEIADDTTYNGVFWTTSYFTFCAISILVVYLTLYRHVEDRASLEELLERAMRGHKRLDQSIELEAQGLLEESQRLARRTKQPLNNCASSLYPVQTQESNIAAYLVEGEANAAAQADQQPAQGNMDVPLPGLDAYYSGNDMLQNLFDIGNLESSDLDMIMDVGFDRTIFDFLDADHGRHDTG
ncbi:hypothetical protein Q7P37_011114 [Cladosporium fusiforme]